MDGTGFKPQHCPQKKKKKQRIWEARSEPT
jgi:hypothetical protein